MQKYSKYIIQNEIWNVTLIEFFKYLLFEKNHKKSRGDKREEKKKEKK